MDAVLALCEENPCYIPPPSQPEQEKEFALPPASANNRRVFAYLLKRGISRKVIEACVRAGILYESADYHNRLAVYEAAIETLAHLTLEGTADKWRLSLGGISAPKEGEQPRSFSFKKPLALESFLKRHPEIEEIEICTNNDFAGRWAAEHLEKAYQGKYRMVKNLPEKEGCDYADLAKERYEKQAARQRAACSR